MRSIQGMARRLIYTFFSRRLSVTLLAVVFLLSGCGLFPGENPDNVAPTPPLFTPLPSFSPRVSPTPAEITNPTSPVDETQAVPPPVQSTPLPTSAETATPTAAPPPENAQAIPDPAGYTWQEVTAGLDSPVGLENAADGSGRLFALEQAGRIRVIQAGDLLATPFLDITDRVGSQGNEQGLLGLAFHPNYPQTGYFYVNYTDLSGDTRIVRYRVSADPNIADPATETLLIFVDQPYSNHNGGQLAFGPDGYLYIGLGDGGAANDPQGNGQSLDTLLGKILRIDVDGNGPDGKSYGIPSDNPYAQGGGLPEIWGYGLRNPWRFSFDRQTYDLYIADVGQNQYEEINFTPAGSPGGLNYGWDYREAAHEFEGLPPADFPLVDPVAEYTHSQGCSVTGGHAYRGMNLPEFRGVYFYGDFCSGIVWGLLRGAGGSWSSEVLYETSYSITSFGEDENGEIYLVDRSGVIFRLAKK